MSMTLARAMCNGGLVKGFAEVRRYISAKSITVNGDLATAWDQVVHVGDVIKLGKRRTYIVQ